MRVNEENTSKDFFASILIVAATCLFFNSMSVQYQSPMNMNIDTNMIGLNDLSDSRKTRLTTATIAIGVSI